MERNAHGDDAGGSLAAMGVDGARGGWVAACSHVEPGGDPPPDHVPETRLELCRDIEQLMRLRESAGGRAVVAIDIPIGLPDTAGFRLCDLEARAILREVGRASSVFAPPARYMLEAAGDYRAIRALVEEERRRDPAAKSISAQAAAIAPKVKEVDDWVRAHPDSEEWLFECHPELSWHQLSGGEPLLDKRSGAGLVRRLRLLAAVFPDAEERIAAAPWTGGQATLSDLLDAYAALSTALAAAGGETRVLGGDRDREGVPMRMLIGGSPP